MGLSRGEGTTERRLATLLARVGRGRESEASLRRSIALLERTGDAFQEALSRRQLAWILRANGGDVNEALRLEARVNALDPDRHAMPDTPRRASG